ncbi:histidine--tRNA ligase, partial [Candidatus Bathyarchaeota archaeon]
MRDIWPEEMEVRLWVFNRIVDVLRRYCFRLVEPSPIESLEVLEAKSGPSIREEIYWFEDKGGRLLGLRFDLTVGLARMVAGRPDLAMPVKLAAVSNMWRYDEPQHGRYRCFYQWDAEIFGSSKPDADAEIVALSIDLLEALGLKEFEVRVSSRRLAEGFLNSIGVVSPETVESILRVIDKFRKLSSREFQEELLKAGLSQGQLENVMSFLEVQAPAKEALSRLQEFRSKGGEKFEQGLREVEETLEVLSSMGKTGKVLVDTTIVRGLDYYDGFVFEVYDRLEVGLGALVGGGRYDGLCKIYGRDLPATGAAGGIERTLLALEKRGKI